jgi:hypothetical protein
MVQHSLFFENARAILSHLRTGITAAFDGAIAVRHIAFMRLGYFTMPLHPPQRDPLLTLQEDREAVPLADKLGFHDAFVGEHLTDRCENVTNSFVFRQAEDRNRMANEVMPRVNNAIGGSAKEMPREAAQT